MIALAALLALVPFLTATPLPRAAAESKVELHWNGTCLDLITPSTYDSQIVRMNPCTPTSDRYKNLQYWDIPAKDSAGPIKLSGTNFCLDAGDAPLADGREMKIWTCYEGLYQQTWYRTADDHLAIVGDTQCLDVIKGYEYGDYQTGNLQTWTCSGGDFQQIFTT